MESRFILKSQNKHSMKLEEVMKMEELLKEIGRLENKTRWPFKMEVKVDVVVCFSCGILYAKSIAVKGGAEERMAEAEKFKATVRRCPVCESTEQRGLKVECYLDEDESETYGGFEGHTKKPKGSGEE